jgi:hypothetical protein
MLALTMFDEQSPVPDLLQSSQERVSLDQVSISLGQRLYRVVRYQAI